MPMPFVGCGQSVFMQQAVVEMHALPHFVKPPLQATTHVFVDVSHVATPLAGCAQSELMQQPVIGMHPDPHCLYPALHVNPHWPPLHVAAVAFAGTGQGVQDVPHEFTLVSSKQLPLHSCVPLGQLPLHAMLDGMHVPKHSF